MTKSNQIITDYIVTCLKKGMQSGKILAQVGKKWQKSVRTANRLLKVAKEQHTIEQAAIKSKLVAIDTEAAIEARKKAIMTADERKEHLTLIITCKSDIKKFGNQFFQIVEFPDGRKEFINQADKLKAISELNKMEGDYAPTKQEITGKDGERFKITLNL